MDDRQHIAIPHASGETVEYVITDQSGHSATVTSTYPTYPTPAEINLPGELAICTLNGYESIHVKNTDNEVVSWNGDSVRDKKLTNWTSHNGGLVANDLARPTNGMLSVTEGAQASERLILFEAVTDDGEGDGEEPKYANLHVYGQKTGKYGTREDGFITDLQAISRDLATGLTAYTNFVITLANYPASGETHDVMIVRQNGVFATPMFRGGPYTAMYCYDILGLEGLDKQDEIKVSKVTYALPPTQLSVASGIGSHSEGSATSTNTTGAHAEGSKAQSNGNYAHAEGTDGIASGIGSSSHNAQCTSNGNYSSTYGYLIQADEQGEFACGAANLYEGKYPYKWVDRIFSVGDGLCLMPHTNGTEFLAAPLECRPHDALAVSRIEGGYDSSGGTHALTINLLPENILITAIESGQTATHNLNDWLKYANSFEDS